MVAYRYDKIMNKTIDVITPNGTWCDFLFGKQKLRTIDNFTTKKFFNYKNSYEEIARKNCYA